MINNIIFGKCSDSKMKRIDFYVYQNLSGNALISPLIDDWIGIQGVIEKVLSHETLHKVIFKLEGGKTSTSLDIWCRSREWFYYENTGICFFSDDFQ